MKKLPFIFLCGIALLTTACAVQSSSESKKDCPGAPRQVGALSTLSAAPENLIGSWTVRQFDTLLLSDEKVPFPMITFRDDAKVIANAGCNTLSGEYNYAAPASANSTAPASVSFSDKFYQTLMYCADEEIARNEQLLLQAMDSVLTVTTCDSDSLRLQGKHSMLLVRTNATN
ncbi:MAG: META domain-containing protein [Paludibacteraceae bacterium]